ncbi:hypothetical protein E2C01_062605 [Portunus trituberculatus]|uniref:Uncharacterized protein n=1 Tax=Portunus trituberculatus TaxID=210409 RepID=A0A5B7HFR2_PORTR|nr:hypothetical protein [Portunus trituberculatus]
MVYGEGEGEVRWVVGWVCVRQSRADKQAPRTPRQGGVRSQRPTYLVSPLEAVPLAALQLVVLVDELADAVLPHVVCVLLGLRPGQRRALTQKPHGAHLACYQTRPNTTGAAPPLQPACGWLVAAAAGWLAAAPPSPSMARTAPPHCRCAAQHARCVPVGLACQRGGVEAREGWGRAGKRPDRATRGKLRVSRLPPTCEVLIGRERRGASRPALILSNSKSERKLEYPNSTVN